MMYHHTRRLQKPPDASGQVLSVAELTDKISPPPRPGPKPAPGPAKEKVERVVRVTTSSRQKNRSESSETEELVDLNSFATKKTASAGRYLDIFICLQSLCVEEDTLYDPLSFRSSVHWAPLIQC